MERRFAVVHDGALDLFDVVKVDTLLSAAQIALAAVTDEASVRHAARQAPDRRYRL